MLIWQAVTMEFASFLVDGVGGTFILLCIAVLLSKINITCNKMEVRIHWEKYSIGFCFT